MPGEEPKGVCKLSSDYHWCWLLELTAGLGASLQPCRQPAKDATECAPQRRRGQVVDEGGLAGAEGTN